MLYGLLGVFTDIKINLEVRFHRASFSQEGYVVYSIRDFSSHGLNALTYQLLPAYVLDLHQQSLSVTNCVAFCMNVLPQLLIHDFV